VFDPFPSGFDAFDRTVTGTTNNHGTPVFDSQLFLSLRSLRAVPTGMIDQWADQIGFWLTQQQDEQANQSIIPNPIQVQVPINGSLSGQAAAVSGAGRPGAADPQVVFTLAQRLHAAR
jgi:hypothetical protein